MKNKDKSFIDKILKNKSESLNMKYLISRYIFGIFLFAGFLYLSLNLDIFLDLKQFDLSTIQDNTTIIKLFLGISVLFYPFAFFPIKAFFRALLIPILVILDIINILKLGFSLQSIYSIIILNCSIWILWNVLVLVFSILIGGIYIFVLSKKPIKDSNYYLRKVLNIEDKKEK